jgi:nitroimidazol reductase NimA-like FMN-containing flavoprotein (pyridoxamine 5'-phosphate oxidase superfamily)
VSVAKLDLSLGEQELDDFLRTQRTLRLATTGPGGDPQVIPLWFVWFDGQVFMNSTRGNVSVRNLDADPRAAGVIDDGETYDSFRGVLLRGRISPADDDQRIGDVESTWSRKYLGGNPIPYRRWRNRVWLRLAPDRISSWDFRKIQDAKARARGAQGYR